MKNNGEHDSAVEPDTTGHPVFSDGSLSADAGSEAGAARSLAASESAAAEGGPLGGVDDEDEGRPVQRITLDHAMRRRRPRQPMWMHLVALVMMLAALVAVIVYQDRCGETVSRLMFAVDPGVVETAAPAVAGPQKAD